MDPKSMTRVLNQVFRPKLLVEKTLMIAKGCSQAELAYLWKMLLPKAIDLRQKATILGNLLKSALRTRSAGEAKGYVLALARISSDSAVLASYHFWAAIAQEQAIGRKAERVGTMLMDLATLYMDHAQTLAIDRQKLSRLGSENSLDFMHEWNALKQESYEAKGVVRLPLAFAVPPVRLRGEASVDFIASVFQDFK
jgi:hypothetical protein